MLCLERGQHVVGMILDNIIVNVRSPSRPIRPRLNVNVSHISLPYWIILLSCAERSI
jgi:hypothetical protein